MRLIAWGALGALMLGGMAAAQQRARLPEECRKPIVEQCQGQRGQRQCVMLAMQHMTDACRILISDAAAKRSPLPDGMREVAYGADPRQRIDLAPGAPGERKPLLVFIHGGGWSIGDKRQSIGPKVAMATRDGYAFASINYRLVPGASVEDEAGDVAAAIAFLRKTAASNGVDPDRIVIMGHSAGAHLAALVSSDPTWLMKAGVPLASVRGVILLDGAAYDVGKQLADPSNPVEGMYKAAFGTEVARQQRLSPTAHAAAPNIANWLILPIQRRADSTAQSQALADGLRAGGASVTLVAVPGESHATLNKGLGEEGDFATGQVDRFLAAQR